MKAQQMKETDIADVILVLTKMLHREEYFSNGLCFWASYLAIENEITNKQKALVHEYIKSNKPNSFWSMDKIFNKPSVFYWKEGDIKPRIKWIKMHIDILKKELEYRGY